MKAPVTDIENFGDLSEKEVREMQRMPPGQHIVKKWPVLSAEREPDFDGKNWDVSVDGLVENPVTWKWEDFLKLPKKTQVSDIHCVTTWSMYDMEFGGIAFNDILEIVKPLPEAKFVTFEAYSGYTSALPLKGGYLDEADVLLCYEHDGKPLEKSHGGPLRSLVPQLFLWKSVKWLTKMHFLKDWERGFWEVRGYHQRGDPWLEERYSSQERVRRRDHKVDSQTI